MHYTERGNREVSWSLSNGFTCSGLFDDVTGFGPVSILGPNPRIGLFAAFVYGAPCVGLSVRLAVIITYQGGSALPTLKPLIS